MRFFSPIPALSKYAVDGLFRLLGRAAAAGILGAMSLSILVLSSVRAADQPATQSTGAASRPSATVPPPQLSVKLNSVGDAEIEYLTHLAPDKDDPKLPAAENLDSCTGLVSTLFQTHNVQRRRDHVKHTVVLQCLVPGLGRPRSDGNWELRLPEVFDADFLHASFSIDGAQVILRADPRMARFSNGPLECRVTLPKGFDGVELLARPSRLAFQMPAPALAVASDKTVATVDFHLDVQPQLFSCLAKTYGYDYLDLWAARTRFTNTGSQPLTHYRVRFRLQDYTSDWSEWYLCPTLLPCQTVIAGYFPILDLDKVARTDGTRREKLQVQYEYTQPDGAVITQTAADVIDILAHNDIPLRNLSVMPMVMASFATKDDPIIQKVAAMVSAQVPGGIDQSKRAGRLQFMRELYRFMLHNKFAYTISSGDSGLQQVKFGRDVVLNGTGTCIDLAIFYNSVCEAVGIETRFYLIPIAGEGHCFPAVYVPEEDAPVTDAQGQPIKDKNGKVVTKVVHEGAWMAVETTMIGKPDKLFDFALAAGGYEQEHADPSTITIDIQMLRAKGVHSLELPHLDDSALANALTNAHITATPPDLTGIWTNQVNNVIFMTAFRNDGSMAVVWTDANSGATLYQGTGRYTYDGKCLTYSFPPASQEGTIDWTDADHLSYRTVKSTVPGAVGVETVMTRVKEEPAQK